jgi:hypothetical protein
MSYTSSVVFVGKTADLIDYREVERLVKLVADRSRKFLARNVSGVSVRLHAMFAKLRPTIILNDGEEEAVLDLGRYDDDYFPNVGDEWEWRDRYTSPIRKSLFMVRDDVREMLNKAREEHDDAQYVLVDSIEITKWQ